MRWCELRPPGSQAAIALVTWFPEMAPGSLRGLVLETPDVRAAVADLERLGVAFPAGVRDDPWGSSASFADPDGNGWVLMQPAGTG